MRSPRNASPYSETRPEMNGSVLRTSHAGDEPGTKAVSSTCAPGWSAIDWAEAAAAAASQRPHAHGIEPGCTLCPRRHGNGGPIDAEQLDYAREPFDRPLAQRGREVPVAQAYEGFPRDDDFAGARGGAEACGQVHRVTEHSVVETLLGAHVASDDVPGVEADSESDRCQPLGRATLVQVVNVALHGQRRANRAIRVIRARDRRAEQRHHFIAHIFVDHATLRLHGAAEMLHDLVQEPNDI